MLTLFAVITGDLIGSTAAGPAALTASMHVISSTAAQIGFWPGSSDTRFTRSRGDGWQMVLDRPGLALRAAFVLQARLRSLSDGIPTRISIGVGAAVSLGTADLSDASGPAFTASGKGLDQMATGATLALTCGPGTPFQHALAALADALMCGWTPQQAEATALALHPANPTLAEMAAKLGISKQAINYRLAGANLRALRLSAQDWQSSFDAQLVEGV